MVRIRPWGLLILGLRATSFLNTGGWGLLERGASEKLQGGAPLTVTHKSAHEVTRSTVIGRGLTLFGGLLIFFFRIGGLSSTE